MALFTKRALGRSDAQDSLRSGTQDYLRRTKQVQAKLSTNFFVLAAELSVNDHQSRQPRMARHRGVEGELRGA